MSGHTMERKQKFTQIVAAVATAKANLTFRMNEWNEIEKECFFSVPEMCCARLFSFELE